MEVAVSASTSTGAACYAAAALVATYREIIVMVLMMAFVTARAGSVILVLVARVWATHFPSMLAWPMQLAIFLI